jgi:uncharacterized membrane protein YphA (DoxX/SURF4 family)
MPESPDRLSVEAVADRPVAAPASRSALSRIGIRFTFLYFLLYCYFGLPIIPFAGDWLATPIDRAWRLICPWIAVHVFHLSGPVTQYHPTGSGDTTLDYIRVFCYAVLAALGALLWSTLDRKESRSQMLYPWVRLILRFYLAAVLLFYGFSKIFPLQFPAPDFIRLSETFGEASPMGLLWAFMGASQPYEMFSGVAEVIPGLLLLFRRTTTVGALIAVAVLSNIVALNFCFDVPVKLFSSHLLLMALFLLVADSTPLWNFFMLHHPAQLRGVGIPRWERRALRASAVALQILVIGDALYGAIHTNYAYYKQSGAVANENRLLSGVWELDVASDSSSRSAANEGEWRRLYMPPTGRLGVRTATGTLLRFTSSADEKTHTLHLKGWRNDHVADLSYLLADNHLILTGTIDRKHVDLRYHRLDSGRFLLTTRGFHWISEDPYNL